MVKLHVTNATKVNRPRRRCVRSLLFRQPHNQDVAIFVLARKPRKGKENMRLPFLHRIAILARSKSVPAAGLVLLLLFACNHGTQASERVNILFIAIDDLKPALGSYDAPVRTPAMDRLAEEGTAFLNAHCQQAVCGPSRASLLPGRRPDAIGVHDLKTNLRNRLPKVVTLPQHFKAHGYQTAGVGKVFDTRNIDKRIEEEAWSVPFAKSWKLPFFSEATGDPAAAHYQDPRIKELDKLAIEASEGSWSKRKKFLQKNEAWPAWERIDVPDNAYKTGAIAEQGIAWLNQFGNADKPFFIAVGFMKPHLPFVAPERYWQLYDSDEIELASVTSLPEGAPRFAGHSSAELRPYSGIPRSGPLPDETQRTLIHAYRATVSYVDAQVARLLEVLETAGLSDNTIVVLWGDHGFHLGDHGLWCKHTNFEQATRVPLILKGPGLPAAQKAAHPVELLDIFPTLCEASGIPAPEALQGSSLLLPPDERPRKYAVSQYPRPGKMGYAIRTAKLRYVAWYKVPGKGPNAAPPEATPVAEELYDYREDPMETINRIDDPRYANAVDQLRTELTKFLREP